MKKTIFLTFTIPIVGILTLFIFSCSNDGDNNIVNSDNTFTDSRDGNVYKTVKIDTQVWMAENLRYLPSVVGSVSGSQALPLYYVFGYNGTDVTENYSIYGVLYNWEAAKIASPEGWHLPSDAEWAKLINYLGGEDVAGGKLKETGIAHWASPNVGATNESGFTALPGGSRFFDGKFLYLGYDGYWWSSTEISSNYPWGRFMYYNNISVYRSKYNSELGYSVRYIKD